jgi:tetratricopeptide (TPR) repeat protein
LPKAGLVEALVLKYKETKEDRWIKNAEQALREAEAIDPDCVPALLAGGRLETSNGHYEEALQNYRRVQELQPRNIEVLLRIAEIDDDLKLRNEAIESYRTAIALEPGNYETYEEFGAYLYHHGEYAPAADQFRKVIERAPRFYNAYANLGAALSDMGQDEAAESALLMSLKLKVTAGALNSLGAIKAYQKRDAEAVVLYKRAVAIDPKNYVYPENLGDSSRRQGLADDARNAYLKSSENALAELKADPRDAAARAYVGYLAARLDDRERAQQEIDQVLQMDPKNKTVIRHAVLTYEVLGQRSRALEVAGTATKDLVRELDRHPDLAGFRDDPRFRELKAKKAKGG